MRSRVLLSAFCSAVASFVASHAGAQDFDDQLQNVRIAELEQAQATQKTELITRFGTDNIAELIEGLKTELAETKSDVARLSGEVDSLRAEVRALSSKPGETPTLTLRAPFAVVDAAGKDLFRVDATAGTRVGAPLAVASSDRTILSATTEGLRATDSFTLNTAAGKPAAVMQATAGRMTSLTLLADDGAGSVAMGVVNGGSGFLEVNEPAGITGVRVGAVEGNKMGVRVMSADKIQASLGLDDSSKGILRVGDPAGARGVLGSTRSGGLSFALYDGASGDYRVGMLAASDSTFVRVNGQGSSVLMNADAEGGALHLFNKAGSAAASLVSTTSGFGQMSLGNADGETVVEAGTTSGGLGVVRAGPRMGGTVGLEGMPFAILGKK